MVLSLVVLAILSIDLCLADTSALAADRPMPDESMPRSTPLIQCDVGLILPLLIVGLMIARSIRTVKK